MPGHQFTAEQKIEAGERLDDLGVDQIQPGFPATGETDLTAVQQLTATCSADICAIARSVESDIDAALESNADIIQIFAPISDLQLDHVLGKSRAETVEILDSAIRYATDHGVSVECGLMDGFRTDPAIIADVCETIPDVSAYVIPDTVGATTPNAVDDFLESLSSNGIDLADVGVHFHDDLGLATANALTAVRRGVGKVDVSVGGLGERAGNTAMEELVVATSTDGECPFDVVAGRLIPRCTEVLEILDVAVPPRKPILGGDVYSHESGIHTRTMLIEPATFEPFDPATFGGHRSLVFGEGTGAGSAKTLLRLADRSPDDDTVNALLALLAEEGPVNEQTAIELAQQL